MNNYLIKIFKLCVLAIGIYALGSNVASAFPTTTYADNSRLASGKWVKISVPANGVYAIPPATLRQWGFSNPENVRVYGYGANRIPDILSIDNYIDDLPMAPSEYTQEHGLVFFGYGPESWEEATSGRFRQNLNIYTTAGYYFLSDTAEQFPELPAVGTPQASAPATFFNDRIFHEAELESPSESGYLLVGEDFRLQRQYTFNFDLTDIEPDTQLWMETSSIVRIKNNSVRFSYTANGKELPQLSNDVITPSAAIKNYTAYESLVRRNFAFSDKKLSLNVSFNTPNSGTVQGAWLNYITINYTRALRLNDQTKTLLFYSNKAELSLAGTQGCGKVRIWDVTSPKTTYRVNASEPNTQGSMVWSTSGTETRTYAAWSDKSKLPAPSFVGNVANQNLHAHQPVQMVIFSIPELMTQAERVAQMHRDDKQHPLTVSVVNVENVYLEFASGSADVSALRKYLKMIFDRGAGTDSTLQYALLLGRPTYEHRAIGSEVKAAYYKPIPQWMGGTTRQQLADTEGFGTDDFIAMLDDNSGSNLGLDNLSVAVGRMPFRTTADAKSYIDKLIQYNTKSPKSSWKNSFMLLADDEDNGIHLEQTEDFYEMLAATPDQQYIFNKVYLDAFKKSNSIYPEARKKMFNLLDEGVAWWNFIGHANNHGWTHDGQLTFTDIMNMYLTHVPILFAATCDFLRWDSPTTSGCEIMWHERYGGIIAAISATRPVYISDNGYFIKSMGRTLLKRDENGNLRTLGDIYRTAKNNILNGDNKHVANPNRLRYVLMGDPAMRIATPSNHVILETIGGKKVGLDQPDLAILAALQQTDIEGYVASPDGKILEDFNGTVIATIYDAERSVTSNGNGEGKQITFDEIGSKLFAGSAQVKDGRFKLRVAMPSTIDDNFRPGTINMYAYASNSDVEAVGVNREFYIYGFDETAPADTEAPIIKTYILNHSSFRNGDTVNESPLVIAEISDNVAINLSQTGIGQIMTLTLDGAKTYTDVTLFYTPSTDGTPSGTINYPLENLTPGKHTLTLRIWDTSGNSASSTIDFVVQQGLTPVIYDVYTDANPASVEANFYLSHNRPNSMLTVEVSVYNLLGHQIWTSKTTGMSDMYLSSPVTWDLTDSTGRRVNRGIYLFRARITSDGQSYDTISRKIAVTGH